MLHCGCCGLDTLAGRLADDRSSLEHPARLSRPTERDRLKMGHRVAKQLRQARLFAVDPPRESGIEYGDPPAAPI